MTLSLKPVHPNDGYVVCLHEDGIEECTLVKSVGEAYREESRLREIIRRRAFNALIENAAENRHSNDAA